MLNSCINYLDEAVKRCPNKLALSDSEKEYSFEKLKRNALCVAQHLNLKEKNQPVVVLMQKSSNSVLSFLGTLYTGNFYVPVDIKTPAERLEKILTDLNPSAIIIDEVANENFGLLLANKDAPILRIEKILESNEPITYDYESKVARVIDSDPIYCIYTSGSTGNPKGVLVSHRGVVDYMNYTEECYDINADAVFGNQAQFHFDISVLDLYGMLKHGATMHIIPENFFTFPGKLIPYLEMKKVNTIYWVPSVMNHVANTDSLSLVKEQYLKKILFAGEVMPVKTLNYWRRKFPLALFSNLYGPTEITITCTYYTVDREFQENESLPIGKPCRNSDVFLLDEQDQLIDKNNIGVVAELCVRGSSLALGYWNDFEKTNKAFVQNPLNKSFPEKIYKTGDLVKYNERGEIIFLGRKDHQFKHMGYRIEIGEIEKAINSLEQVASVCVFYDEQKKEIVCCYEKKDDNLHENTLRKELADKLPRYMIPTAYYHYPKLPISGTGKIDRTRIKNEIRPQ